MPTYRTNNQSRNLNNQSKNLNKQSKNLNNEFRNLNNSKSIANRDIISLTITYSDIFNLNKKASNGTLTDKDFKGKFENTKFIAVYLSKIKDENLFYSIEPLLDYLSNRIIGGYHGSTILRTYLLYSENININIVKYLLGDVNNASFSLDVNAINHYRSNSVKSYIENQYIKLNEDIFDLLLKYFDPNGIIETDDNPDRTININLVNYNEFDKCGTKSTLLHAICKNHSYFTYGIQKLLDLDADVTLTCSKRYLKKQYINNLPINFVENNKFTPLDILKLHCESNDSLVLLDINPVNNNYN